MIYRTYGCVDCDTVFEVCHESGDEPSPPCPNCERVLDWHPKPFGVKSNISRGADLAQQILNEDYALDNFNDNTREGDTVYKAPVETREQREAARMLEQHAKMVKDMPNMIPDGAKQQAATFWGGGQGGGAVPHQVVQSALANAKAPLYDRRGKVLDQGVNPMESLHRAGRAGKLPNNLRIIAGD